MRFILLMLISIYAEAEVNTVRLFDTGEPIALKLSVGNEVNLRFNHNIKSVAVKANIKSKLSLESIDKRWWLKANSVFAAERILVKDEFGRIIVFIVSSTTKQDNKTAKYRVITQNASVAKAVITTKNISASREKITLVELTRFAAQMLYAPKRLVKDIGLNRAPITTTKIDLFDCQNNTWCADTISKPLASWTDGVRYVSAIEVKNLSNSLIDLDPRSLLGDFLSATFQFNRIGEQGSNVDITVLYVVTNKPLEQSL